jgi:phage protein U
MSMANDSGNNPVMMVLGDFQFSLNSIVFQEWQRSTGWKWPAQERFGQLDALQFTGLENDTLQLPGVLYPNWKGDIGSLDDLRQMADAGVPYLLVDSMGFVQGRWVIEKLDEKQAAHDASGTPRKVEFSLALKKFDDGEVASDASDILDSVSSAASAASSAATSGTSAALSGFASMAKSVQSGAASALGSLKSAAAQVSAAVTPVMTQAASAVGALNRSIDVVNDLRATANDVAAQVKSIGTVAGALSGTKTLMDKVSALGTHAASATRVVDNIRLISGVPAAATNALNAASTATTGVSTLLASTENAASALLKKLTS